MSVLSTKQFKMHKYRTMQVSDGLRINKQCKIFCDTVLQNNLRLKHQTDDSIISCSYYSQIIESEMVKRLTRF